MSHKGRKIKIAFLFFSTSNEKNFFPLASNSYSILKSEFIKKERDFLFFFNKDFREFLEESFFQAFEEKQTVLESTILDFSFFVSFTDFFSFF